MIVGKMKGVIDYYMVSSTPSSSSNLSTIMLLSTCCRTSANALDRTSKILKILYLKATVHHLLRIRYPLLHSTPSTLYTPFQLFTFPLHLIRFFSSLLLTYSSMVCNLHQKLLNALLLGGAFKCQVITWNREPRDKVLHPMTTAATRQYTP